MSNNKSFPRSLSILILLGAIGLTGFIWGLATLTPSIKALMPMFLATNSDDYETRYISAESMLPTFEIGDRLLIDKKVYRNALPQRGDVIVFNPPDKLRKLNYEKPFVKRIIGLPGETVEIKNGSVYIDNMPIKEDYILAPPEYTSEPQKIPANSYYVLGDNRNNSHDSHYWGYVHKALIIGQVIGIYFPPSRVKEFD